MKLSAAIVMPAAEVTRIGSDENDTTVSVVSLILRRNDHLETPECRCSRSYWISVWRKPASRIRPDIAPHVVAFVEDWNNILSRRLPLRPRPKDFLPTACTMIRRCCRSIAGWAVNTNCSYRFPLVEGLRPFWSSTRSSRSNLLRGLFRSRDWRDRLRRQGARTRPAGLEGLRFSPQYHFVNA